MASWLATRGLATLHLRIGRAMENAMSVAGYLAQQAEQQFGSLLEEVRYPGLPSHPDHELANRQLQGGFGSMVSFRLAGNEDVADRFLKAADSLPFCPSLGEASTTLSHPASTSHRDMDDSQRAKLGITGGTIRLSVGIESTEFILKAIEQGLMGAKG
jgi:cystathionine beta-lyase/cystathionine gamma-synthase